MIILSYPQLFEHLLNMNLVKNPLKSHLKQYVEDIKNKIYKNSLRETFIGFQIANSPFTHAVIRKRPNERKRFIIRDGDNNVVNSGNTKQELIDAITFIITYSILLTIRKRRIILNETDN